MAARIINAAHGAYPGIFVLEFDIDRAAGEIDTGYDFKKGDLIMHACVKVATAEVTAATKTIDVGLLSSESGGDADGILDGVVTSATGVVGADATATDGTSQNFWAAAPKLGALMRTGELGGDAAGTAGVMIPRPHVVNGTAVSLTYTLGGAATELVAKGYIVFFRVPVAL
jgi:hypothetical protein